MRTSGDDIAEVLALLGVRPVLGRRVATGGEPGADVTGRARAVPRIDVTVRISGFFPATRFPQCRHDAR